MFLIYLQINKFEKLLVLHTSKNKISSFTNIQLPLLKELNLSENNLLSITMNGQNELKDLRVLNLSNNPENQQIPINTSEKEHWTIVNLEKLHTLIVENTIIEFKPNTFHNNPEIVVLKYKGGRYFYNFQCVNFQMEPLPKMTLLVLDRTSPSNCLNEIHEEIKNYKNLEYLSM